MTSSRGAPTQVRCGATSKFVSRRIRITKSCVLERVEPSAPYVTETNLGRSGARRRTADHSWSAIAASLGGKNSKDTVTAFDMAFHPGRIVTRQNGPPLDPEHASAYAMTQDHNLHGELEIDSWPRPHSS